MPSNATIIVNERKKPLTPGASARANKTAGSTVSPAHLTSPEEAETYKDGTYYIDEKYTIRRHNSNGEDTLVYAPRTYTPRNDEEKKRVADTFDKMQRYTRLKMLIEMRDLVQKILNQQESFEPEQNTDPDTPFPWAKDQETLKTLYQSFYETYGAINKFEFRPIGKLDANDDPIMTKAFSNVRKFRKDPTSWKVMSLVEEFDEDTGEARPGPIFEAQYISGRNTSLKIETPLDALRHSENKTGRIDFELMAKVLNDQPVVEIEKSLSKDKHIFLNPETNEWEFAADYFSGFIYEKLDAAEKAAKDDPRFKVNVSALKEITPPPTPVEEMDLTLGMSWIPPELIAEFAEEKLGLAGVKIDYVPQTHRWFVSGETESWLVSQVEFGTEYADSRHLLERTLNQMDPIIRKRRDEDGNELDPEMEKISAKQRQEVLIEAFKDWILEDKDRRDHVNDTYNRKLNGFLARSDFDAGHIIYPGLSMQFQPREHQKQAAYRMGNGNTLLFHDPGTGKTASIIMGIQRMLATGQIKHACIVTPPAVLNQFAREWVRLFPNADIFDVKDDKLFEQGGPVSQQERLAVIARRSAQHQVTLMSKPAFDRIDISPQARIQLFLDKIRELDTQRGAFEEGSDAHRHITKRIVKEKTKLKNFLLAPPQSPQQITLDESDLSENLTVAENDNIPSLNEEDEYTDYDEFLDMEEARDNYEDTKESNILGYSQNIYQREEEEFHTLNDLIYTDADQPAWKDFIAALSVPNSTYWEDFKFDHFTIDEAHSDRNLNVESRRMELSLQGSERAARTERKLTHMRKTNPDCHYTASTGTALTNRMSEIFTWQRFMAPDHLKAVNIHCYDAWLATYGYQSTELEITPDLRNWEPRTRYRGYKSVPSLLSLFHNFTDNIVNADLSLNLPDVEGGSPQSILVERTPQLDEYAQEVWRRLDRIKNEKIDLVENDISSIMQTLQLEKYTGEIWERIDKLQTEDADLTKNVIFDILSDFDLHQHTPELWRHIEQIQEGDPDQRKDNIIAIMHEMHQMAIDPRLAGRPKHPEYKSKIDVAAEHIAEIYHTEKDRRYNDPKTGKFLAGKGVCQLVTCDEGIPKTDGSFSSHMALKEKLIELGVPAHKIQFIHDYESQDKKMEFYRRCNTANIAVAIGTSQKLGVGANIQRKLRSLFLLTPSYLPADTQQTIARIVRQGNLNPEVKVAFLLQEGSSDTYRWQLNQRKARSIHQIRTGVDMQDTDSHAENADEYTSLFESLKLAAANDENVIAYGQVRAEYDRLSFQHKAYQTQKDRQLTRKDILQESINQSNKYIEAYTARKEAVSKTKTAISIDGTDYKNAAEAGQALKTILRNSRASARAAENGIYETVIGAVHGFNITAKTSVTTSERTASNDNQDESRTTKSYNYTITLTIDDPNGKIEIPVSSSDLAEKDFEKAFLKAAKSDEDQNLTSEFENAVEEEESLMTAYANFANRLLESYTDLDSKISAETENIVNLSQQAEMLDALIATPFPHHKQLRQMKNEVERLMHLINENKNNSSNDNTPQIDTPEP